MSERGTRWLLVAVLVAQLFLIAAQLPDPGGNSSLLEASLVRTIAPLGRLIDGVYDLVGAWFSWAARLASGARPFTATMLRPREP